MITLLLAAMFSQTAMADTSNTVQFTPVLRFYECPPTFTYRSDCKMKEKTLAPQKLELNLEVLTDRMGQWTVQSTDPITANYYVIVARGPVGDHFEYSISTETGLPGSPAPYANERVEFPDSAIPKSFGVSSSTMIKDGKNYLTELRVTAFHALPTLKSKK
jgi:hypothetical protein